MPSSAPSSSSLTIKSPAAVGSYSAPALTMNGFIVVLVVLVGTRGTCYGTGSAPQMREFRIVSVGVCYWLIVPCLVKSLCRMSVE